MEKNYDHSSEDNIYKRWKESGKMRADNKSTKPPFTIPLPPPNVTGQLHLGHAAMLAIEDILIRFKKMTGHESLWIPGTDHAAIATENVVIKHLGIKSREKNYHEKIFYKNVENLRPRNETGFVIKWKKWERGWIGHERLILLMKNEILRLIKFLNNFMKMI